jgi:hypothetical protein
MEKQEMMEMMKAMLAETLEKMEADRKADHEEMMAMIKAWGKMLDAWSTDTKANGEETMACQETMEVRLEEEEPTSVEMKPEVAHEEVPLELGVGTNDIWPLSAARRRKRSLPR